jgi:hypothetical protein
MRTRTGWLLAAAVVIVILAALAVVSYQEVQWEGGFPEGEIRLTVQDAGGRAIEGAVLKVYTRRDGKLAFRHPIENHVEGEELASDRDGQIVALQTRGGIQFGGRRGEIFWVIHWGSRGAPQYDCVITAAGYRPLTLDFSSLLAASHRAHEYAPATSAAGGPGRKLPVYKHTCLLAPADKR